MIGAAKQHKIKLFVADGPSALYLLNKAGIEGEFRHSAPMFQDELRRAVRKGNTALLREVSDGFAGIDPDELRQINERWRGRTISRIRPYLTYAGYTVAAALLIIAGLAAWNRTLKKRIFQRTAALSESELRFRRLVELMPVAVYVCDTAGVIQSYNRSSKARDHRLRSAQGNDADKRSAARTAKSAAETDRSERTGAITLRSVTAGEGLSGADNRRTEHGDVEGLRHVQLVARDYADRFPAREGYLGAGTRHRAE